MTGPEHYAEAEKHARWAADVLDDDEPTPLSRWNQRQAKIHALLALAASYAEVNPTSEWCEVAGTSAKEIAS